MSNKKACLVILDGWGHGQIPESSAIYKANTPTMDQLERDYPSATLTTYGLEVGLPEGQMGNSEVGHLNIGAGRVVYQELARINKEIADGTLGDNKAIQEALNYAKQNNKPVHFLGLVSDGGVHSHINHLKALCDLTNDHSIPTYIHAFLDGRDTSPNGGLGYLQDLQENIKDKTSKLSSIIGRYYAMDRDQRWERIQKSYDLLIHGIGTPTNDFEEIIKQQYQDDVTDEFIEPIKLLSVGEGLIKPDDVVIFINFRTDRPRQLTEALCENAIPSHGMKPLNLAFYTMTEYKKSFKNVKVIFSKDSIKNTIGEVLANEGKTQVRAAETEKYPHVTFFLSGGVEVEVKGETRILAASPKVSTYDLQPEMSAHELNDKVIEKMKTDTPDFVCLNYANADMVGHTGIMDAAIKAVETVDGCLSDLIKVGLDLEYDFLIIADHGNSDIMVNEDGSPHTAHTTNPVPIIYVSNNPGNKKLNSGKLADIAPTILSIMGIERPAEMTGNVLLS